ncbi:hypothetical protein DPMN_018557, partial [Dreissena polymorpha]
ADTVGKAKNKRDTTGPNLNKKTLNKWKGYSTAKAEQTYFAIRGGKAKRVDAASVVEAASNQYFESSEMILRTLPNSLIASGDQGGTF